MITTMYIRLKGDRSFDSSNLKLRNKRERAASFNLQDKSVHEFVVFHLDYLLFQSGEH